METYVILGNFTQEGIRNIRRAPARIEDVRRRIEAAGGKLLGWHLTLGRYDFVAIAQVPDAERAAALLLEIGSHGNVRTETLRALSEEEFREVVKGLP